MSERFSSALSLAVVLPVAMALKVGSRLLFRAQSTEEISFIIATIIGSLLIGALCGLLPRSIARKRGHDRLARVAFGASIGAGFVGGLILGVPTAVAFTIVALRRPQLNGSASTAANSATAPALEGKPSGALLPVTGGTYGN